MSEKIFICSQCGMENDYQLCNKCAHKIFKNVQKEAKEFDDKLDKFKNFYFEKSL